MLGVRYLAVGAAGVAQPVRVAHEPEVGQEWAVAVDGWRIEVDGATVAPPGVDPLPGVAEDVDDLRLEKLTLYAESIGRHSTDEGIDWRLVAAVIAEESGFRPSAMSRAGAYGLMQVKEEAAREVGVFPYDDPDANIQAGVRYLATMREAFPSLRMRDQQALMLAAYNMGPAHLQDAQSMAIELGMSHLRWDDSLASVVQVLDQPGVYTRLRHGFAQGPAVVRYVERVLQRYAAYRRQFPALTAPSVAMIAEIATR
jgi:membrane-bound lytic murein transglycosylase F